MSSSCVLAQRLNAVAHAYSGRTYYCADGKNVTYGAMAKNARAIASRISSAPWVRLSAPLALSLSRPSGWVDATWACINAGVSLAFMPHCDDPQTMRRLLTEIDAPILVTDNDALASQSFAIHWNELCSAGPAESGSDAPAQGPGAAAGSAAFLLLTSGTTGESRWVECRYAQCARAIAAMVEAGALQHAAGETVFLSCPPFHSYGLSALLEYTFVGGTLIFPDGSSPLGPVAEVLRGAISQHVSALEGVPHFYDQLAAVAAKARLPRLRHIGYGGGAINRQSIGRLREVWAPTTVSVRYGLTETPSVVAHKVYGPEHREDWGSSGRVLPNYRVEIQDDNGRPLRRGKTGEVVIESDCLGRYLGAPPQKSFATGDLAYFDSNDELFIVGRRSAFLKNRGFRLSPERIESVAVGLAGVEDCRASMRDGRLVAEIVIGHGGLAIEAVRRHLAERLPSHAVPDVITTVASVPRTPSGKIRRY
jgi:acyl-coenzyme A synthetase/AMP-(fatty) acid ligase